MLFSFKYSTCSRGLFSDCDGKLCKNGGTLDVATCTCSCASPEGELFEWEGEECEKKGCKTITDPDMDPSHEIAKLTGEKCQKGKTYFIL